MYLNNRIHSFHKTIKLHQDHSQFTQFHADMVSSCAKIKSALSSMDHHVVKIVSARIRSVHLLIIRHKKTDRCVCMVYSAPTVTVLTNIQTAGRVWNWKISYLLLIFVNHFFREHAFPEELQVSYRSYQTYNSRSGQGHSGTRSSKCIRSQRGSN